MGWARGLKASWLPAQEKKGCCGAGPERKVCSFFFSNSYFLFLKQANKFEFKPGFESKHPTIYLIYKTKERIFPILYFL
jgi:hypothetical protein